MTLEMQGERAAAVAEYRSALTIRPGHVPAATALARTLMGDGAWNDAIAVLERALGLQPRDPALLDALATAKAGAGQQETILDLDGKAVDTRAPGAKGLVLIFVGTDCPISNRYAAEVHRLEEMFAPSGISFITVYPNPAETDATIRQHLREYRLPQRAVRDAAQTLVKRSGASVTPEAAVYDGQGRMVYRGRIDDRYASIGVERPAPSRHDLQDVIAALVEGRPTAPRTTAAVGCFIADLVR
jgi:hypothetical protein